MMIKYDFDIVRPYVRKLLKTSHKSPYNNTHRDLGELWRKHGIQTVTNTLNEYWERFGNNGQRDRAL